MRVVRMIVYTGTEEWVRRTLAKSLPGRMVMGQNVIDVFELGEPVAVERLNQFVCPNCGERKPLEESNTWGNMLLCTHCTHVMLEWIGAKAKEALRNEAQGDKSNTNSASLG